jgi:hypothetical protein
MCKYQIWREGKLPLCEHTKTLCTLCVLGKAITYKEAEKANEKGE